MPESNKAPRPYVRRVLPSQQPHHHDRAWISDHPWIKQASQRLRPASQHSQHQSWSVQMPTWNPREVARQINEERGLLLPKKKRIPSPTPVNSANLSDSPLRPKKPVHEPFQAAVPQSFPEERHLFYANRMARNPMYTPKSHWSYRNHLYHPKAGAYIEHFCRWWDVGCHARRAAEWAARQARAAQEAIERAARQAREWAERQARAAREALELAARKAKEAAELAARKVKEAAELAARKTREAAELAYRKAKEAAELAARKAREAAQRAIQWVDDKVIKPTRDFVKNTYNNIKGAIGGCCRSDQSRFGLMCGTRCDRMNPPLTDFGLFCGGGGSIKAKKTFFKSSRAKEREIEYGSDIDDGDDD